MSKKVDRYNQQELLEALKKAVIEKNGQLLPSELLSELSKTYNRDEMVLGLRELFHTGELTMGWNRRLETTF